MAIRDEEPDYAAFDDTLPKVLVTDGEWTARATQPDVLAISQALRAAGRQVNARAKTTEVDQKVTDVDQKVTAALAGKVDDADPRLTDARTPTTHGHTAAQITDATAVGRSVVTAASATAARTAIGAGTSNLAIGTTGTTAKAGNYAPTKADVGLGNVDNTTDATKPVSAAQAAADAAVQGYAVQRANHTGTQPASTVTGLAVVATSGSYNDLADKPTTTGGGTTGGLEVREGPITPFRYGAVLDGVADDTTAMRQTLAAVPDRGGEVFIPGLARVTGELGTHIKSGTKLSSDTASRYWAYSTATPPHGRGILIGSGFTDTSLFPIPGGRQALTFADLAILGANRTNASGQPIHCFNGAQTTAEQAWVGHNVGIIGFTGDGMRGHSYASRWSEFFIGGCHGWGINPTTYYADTYFLNGYIAGNIMGGVNLAGTGMSGFVDFTNVRSERSGFNSNTNPPTTVTGGLGSPGWRIRRANNCRFVSCSTDANSGHGLDIGLVSSGGNIYDLDFMGCTFKRDGFGDMTSTTQPEYAAVRIAGLNSGTRIDLARVRFQNCSTIYAQATDSDPRYPTYLHPKYGVRADWTANLRWDGGDIDSHAGGRVTSASSANFRDGNYRFQISGMSHRGYGAEVARTREATAEHGLVWDSSLNGGAGALICNVGGVWKNAGTGAVV